MGIWNITVKDLRLILKDRGATFILLALPVVFIAILGASTGQLLTAADELKLLKIGLVDEDGSESAAQVLHDLGEIEGLKIEKVTDRDEAKLQLQDGRSSVIVILGKDFHHRIDELELGDVFDPEHGKLSRGISALDLEIECGAPYVGVAGLMRNVVFSAVMRVVAPQVTSRNAIMSRLIDRAVERHREEATEEVTSPAPSEPVQSSSRIIYQTLVPAFIVMFSFFLVNIMASSFITERTLGTLRRMQATRIHPVQLLLGKTLPFLIVSVLQSLLLFLSGRLMFGMSWGTHPELLLPIIVTTSMSATGLGLLLATIIRTESQVASYSTFAIVVLGGISGCYLPRDWMPEIMQKISLATPHAWSLIAYQELLTREHPRLLLIAECSLMLALFGILGFCIGSWRFRRTEYST